MHDAAIPGRLHDGEYSDTGDKGNPGVQVHQLIKLGKGIATDRRDLAVLRAIMAMSRAHDLRVIAEGIETEAEFVALYRLGIRLMQGYLIAKPALEALPPVSFAQLEKFKSAA